jgi:hypothetical protein
MKRILPALAALALILAVGLLHGMWTNRWGMPWQLEQAIERVKSVPRSVADWEGHDLELDAGELAQVGIPGFLYRTYVQRGTGRQVDVLLVCGRPGPVCVHTPDVCLRGAGYQIGDQTNYRLQGPDAQFRTAGMRKKTPTAIFALRVDWAWSATGRWWVPDNPRWTLGHYPVLYKLYVLQAARGAADPPKAGCNDEFLRAFLPQLNKCLFPSS